MSYVIPSVEVYQQLATSGGVANTTPDLQVCLIGPAYNVLSYVAGSTTSLVNTAATSSLTAIGSMTSGSAVITFTTPVPFPIGDTLLVPGASSTGGILSATVVSVSGYTATLNASAGTTVTNVTVTTPGSIENNTVTNTFNLPGQLPGQVVDPTTINVYLNNALVETLATNFTGSSGNNALTLASATSPGVVTASSTQVTGVTNAFEFVVGDPVTIAGAGSAGATLSTTIAEIIGETVTLATAAGTSVGSATLVKGVISNVNSVSSTLRVEAGDEVEIFYTNNASVAKTFTTTVTSVVNLTGTITNLNLTDVLPSDLSATATTSAAVAANATVVQVSSTTGFSAGDTIIIPGAGAGGSALYTVIGAVGSSPNEFTGLSPAISTALPAAGVVITRVATFTLRTRKLYNNLLLAQTYNSETNYNDSSVGTTGQLTIEPEPATVYGTVISGSVNIAYNALRTDLSASVQTFSTIADVEGTLGDVSNNNPLGLASTICLANTTTQINVIAVPTNDLDGYTAALELAEGATLYALVPLTQEQDILAAFQTHCDQMSTPQNAAWRICLVNTMIPTTQDIGPYSVGFVNANSGNNTITIVAGNYVLTASNATFLSDGVSPGDSIVVTAASGSPTQVGSLEVLEVLSNQQVVVQATGTATAVSYYVSRALSKTQQAAAVAAVSTTFNDQRVIHVQPDICGVSVNSVVMYLPGYYLCAALGGMVAGFPVQQGFTNTGVAGIADLKDSNFYFTRAQLNTIAAAGTFLFVQATQGSIPYVRHELTTNMSALQYRELLCVKNWDWLSYYYYNQLSGFIGKWNITPDALNTLRQTIILASQLVMGQKLPKIGAPLLSYTINSLAQDATELDQVDINMTIAIVYPMNYISLYLVI
jgi:hypothetical protein